MYTYIKSSVVHFKYIQFYLWIISRLCWGGEKVKEKKDQKIDMKKRKKLEQIII